ncbi:CKLF-like MARVEL transmembrane domain-containing protein 6 [Geospiza fortis]|uniref:CKLF-like MARVEL transmembrane domain-containing protein 6 n=1 Tax=Geospiza fortis TaxID=48883 RepID=A0A8N5ERS4_GEOFO|nr:CKLF-like MARVEL transmembrane domain-containing protein 6 [Geospiza fortis]
MPELQEWVPTPAGAAGVVRPRLGAAAAVLQLPAGLKRRPPWLKSEGNLAGNGAASSEGRIIFSLVAVVCEELVEECYNCSALYFFEFVSCSAFLLSLLILYMHCTDLYESLGEDKVQKLNFWAVPVIGVCFLSSSVLLSATCNEPEEYAACVFGFFASCAFAAEFVVELCLRLKQKWNRDGRPEKPRNTRSATENQPLNKQR